jgi:TorA maturation chaperone TorD
VDGAEVTPEVYTDFVENHLRNWTPSFSDALLENTEEPLFVFAAKLLAVA